MTKEQNITSSILNSNDDIIDVFESGSFPFPVKMERTGVEVVKVINEEGETVEFQLDEDASEDIRYARDNYREIMRMGMIALEGISRVAQGTETPEHYEAVAKVMKEASKVNTDMVNLHNIKRELAHSKPGKSKQKADSGSAINVDKAVFVGTPADYLKRIKEEGSND